MNGVLNLWEMAPGTGNGVYVGSLKFLSNGTLEYSSDGSFAAVPEPSTYGLMAGFGLLLVAWRKNFGAKQA
jgi:hypothetical protein